MKNCLFLILLFITSCASNTIEESQAKKAELHYGHGTASLIRGDYTTALEQLLLAIQIDPENSQYNNNLGMAYYFKNEKALAGSYIRKAIELDKKNTDAKMNLASIYMDEGKLEQAEQLYQEVLKDLIYPHHYRTYYNLGALAFKKNDFKKAEEFFKKSLEIKSEYCPSHFQLGLLMDKKQEFRKAGEHLKQSYQGTCTNNPAPHYFYALNSIKLKKYDDARIKLNEIMKRFSSTEYDTKARLKLSELDTIIEQDQFRTEKAQLNSKKHFAPDF